MKIKQVIRRVLCLMIVLAILPTGIIAAGPVSESEGNLTINYIAGDKAIKNASFSIYRIADIDPYGVYTLTEEFKDTSVDLKGHEESHWRDVTEVLEGFAKLNKIKATATGKTDNDGTLKFENLELGLYMVTGQKKTQSNNVYTPNPFLVSVPMIDAETNEWVYSVTLSPKYTSERTGGGGPSPVSRKVVKVWDDEDHEHNRPKEISVVLLKDGEAYDTVKLSKENGWKYEWGNLSSSYEWSVAEEVVPGGYTVSMTKSGNTFVITNTYKDAEQGKDVSRNVIKVWDDKGNESKRPKEVEVVLLKDGKEADKVKLNEQNGWKYEWTKLNAASEWTVEEVNVPQGYKSNVKKDGVVYIITNSYEEETEKPTEPPTEKETEKPTEPTTDKETEKPTEPTTEKETDKPTEPTTEGETDKDTEAVKDTKISVYKVWDDNNNAARPDKVEIEILKDGVLYETVALNKENKWQITLDGLSDSATFTVREKNVPEGYEVNVTEQMGTFVVTNKLIPENVNINVKKVWKDVGNEGERPKKVEAQLLKNGEVYATVELSDENGWEYNFLDLDGRCEWSVKEKTLLDKYTSKVVSENGGFVIINTYSVIPKTGQTWWPIPVLMAIGLLLVCLGIMRRRDC